MTQALRQLTGEDVEFSISTEADETELEGNVLACGDDAEDELAENEIRERLQDGDDSAWCVVSVNCSWHSDELDRPFTAGTSLGCVTLTDIYTLEQCVEEHDLRAEALRALNDHLASMVVTARALARELAPDEPTQMYPDEDMFPPGA